MVLFVCRIRFNLGDKFIAWIKHLYNNPKAQMTNGTLSPHFKLFRGTRQDCSLSPLVVHAGYRTPCGVNLDLNIDGFSVTGTPDKLSVYVDNILLFITRPHSSLSVVLNKKNLFGTCLFRGIGLIRPKVS